MEPFTTKKPPNSRGNGTFYDHFLDAKEMVTFFLREQYMFSFHTLTICYKTLSVLFLIYYVFYIEYKV